MSIIVPSNHTRIGAWGEKSTSNILYNSINRHAKTSPKHRRHGKLGLQLSLLYYTKDRMGVNEGDFQV